MVCRTLAGIHRIHGQPVQRKSPLSAVDLQRVRDLLGVPLAYDDLLFVTQLFLGFDQLLRLGELCISDDARLFDVRRSMKRYDVHCSSDTVRLLLPGHKADRFFEGNTLQFSRSSSPVAPFDLFGQYLSARNAWFCWLPELWLLANGQPPTRSWFTCQLRRFFSSDISGHSMRAGGATALASAGVPDDRIRLRGRWTSDAYQVYLRKNPSILFVQFAHSTLP